MEYELNIERREDYLVARVTGQNSEENVSRYLRSLKEECEKQQCFKVLIDEQLEGPRLDVSKVFSIASEGARDAIGHFQAVAYVEPTMGQMTDFAENVAVNRGMPVRTFATVAEAELWLSKQSEGSNEHRIFEDYSD